jgi:hypothetical protein
MSAGDYPLFRSENAQNRSRRLVANSQKPAIGGPFCEYQGQFLQASDCLARDAVLIRTRLQENSLPKQGILQEFYSFGALSADFVSRSRCAAVTSKVIPCEN